MKKLLSSLGVSLCIAATCFSQNKNAETILAQFVQAHNRGDDQAIEEFIRINYHPSQLEKLEISKQVAFYQQIINEFGILHSQVYNTITDTEHKLIVHLIKEDESLLNREVDPANVLVVEIDLHPENPKYLARGLGLGALICEIRKDKK